MADETVPDSRGQRKLRVKQLVREVIARRAAGETLGDAEVLAAHPDLKPELERELHELALVEQARAAADSPGSAVTRDLAATTTTSARHAISAAESFVGYELLREIHRGGQGVVYLAIQKATKRKVAIKVMHEGPFAGPRDRVRFEREVHILATLNHPDIVAIHDSGTTPNGSFYYVMDYISGKPLDEWITESRPAKVSGNRKSAAVDRSEIEKALQLFAKICDAVNAAHLRGVIHRDLKPGNIRMDANGGPHILDFGLAKVAVGEITEASHPELMTMTGQFIGSLPWASPEQARGNPEQIDVRTDVYSLGVVLYQMLTGRFPYEVTGYMKDVLDNILTAEPARPRTLRREINDEIETIVLKCLDKERERRYQTAGELARDIRHYLAGEPIEAKRDSHWYIAKKVLRRYKVPVFVVSAFAILLLVATVALWFMYRKQIRLLEDVQQVNGLLQGVVLAFEPGRAEQPEKKIAGILDRTSKALEAKIRNQAEVEAPLRYTIGLYYRKIQYCPQAEQHLAAALRIRRQILPSPHADLASNLHELAAAYWWDGYYDKAEPLYREALEMRRKLYGSENIDVTYSLIHLAACVLYSKADYVQAEDLYKQALAIRERLLADPNDMQVVAARNNVARCYLEEGEYFKAEPILRQVLAAIDQQQAVDQAEVARGLNNIATCLLETGDSVGAEAVFDRAQKIVNTLLSDEHPFAAESLYGLARLRFAAGDPPAAETFCQRALTLQRQRLRPDHPLIADSLVLMGRVQMASGELDAGEQSLRDALRFRQQAIPAHWRVAEAESVLGECLAKKQRYAEAEPLLTKSYPIIRDKRGAASKDTQAAVQRLIELYDAWSKPQRAADYRALLRPNP